MEILFAFIFAVLLGLIPASLAQKKGRSFGLWWLYGTCFFIIALPHAMIMDALPDSEEAMRREALERASKGVTPAKLIVVEPTADDRELGEPKIIKRDLSSRDHTQRPEMPGALDRWRALTKYDPEIGAAADALRPFGGGWVDRMGRDFLALNEDKSYLPKIVQTLKEEAQRGESEEWNTQFRYTADREMCSEESLSILRKAKSYGYAVTVQSDGTFLLENDTTTSYLRTNGQILRFGQLLLAQSRNDA